jgi:hypothetical protein
MIDKLKSKYKDSEGHELHTRTDEDEYNTASKWYEQIHDTGDVRDHPSRSSNMDGSGKHWGATMDVGTYEYPSGTSNQVC